MLVEDGSQPLPDPHLLLHPHILEYRHHKIGLLQNRPTDRAWCLSMGKHSVYTAIADPVVAGAHHHLHLWVEVVVALAYWARFINFSHR